MTDVQIAFKLCESRLWARWAKWDSNPEHSAIYARRAVTAINVIIASIDW